MLDCRSFVTPARPFLLTACLLWSTSIAGVAFAQDRFEPNDDISTAHSLALDETVDVSLAPTGDRDFFQVKVSDVGTLRIEFDGLAEGLATPEHVTYTRGSIEYSKETSFAVIAGTYTVGFWASEGATSDASFQFTVRFEPVGVATSDPGGSSGDEEDPDPDPDPPDESEDDSPYRWIGTVDVESRILGTGGQVGEQIKRWSYRIKWRESRRLEVHDDEGRLTGEFVELVEDASSWMASTEGSFQKDDRRTVISGEGGGSGSIRHGWIYFSLSDEDPLAELLGNGTYVAHGDQSQVFDATYQHISRNGTHTSQMPMFAAFNIGRLNWYPYQATGPFRASEIARHLGGVDNPGGDSQLRTLTDGVMEGSYEASLPWSPNTTHTASWRIARQLDVHAELEPPSQGWRPRGPPHNTVLRLDATLHQPEGVAGKFRFTLSEITSEKGYALNAGTEGDDELDFEFDHDAMSDHYDEPFQPEGSSDSWRIESKDLLTRTSVTIRALDYGAWARLKAEVNVDGQWYDVQLDDGESETTVPLDADEDHIADGWEQDHEVANQDGASDEDAEPEQIEPEGDGFSNYEEYRGFEVQGVWTDTDPRVRDIFVHDELGFGTGLFHATGLEIHVINQDEYDTDRTVNRHRGLDTLGPQKGLRLVDGDLPSGVMGQVAPTVGSPAVVEKVMVDLDNHAAFLRSVDPSHYESLQDYADAGSETAAEVWLEKWEAELADLESQLEAVEAKHELKKDEPGYSDLDYIVDKETLENNILSLKDLIARTEAGIDPRAESTVVDIEQTIAHELGHGVAIPHHGQDWGACPGDTNPTGTPTLGGKWSGVLTCIMRYTVASNYIDGAGACHEYADPKPTQDHFCESQGSDSEVGLLGPATVGKCLKQIVLKGEVVR